MNIKEIIQNFKEEDFWENVNLHIHSNCSDGLLSPDMIADEAYKKGLKYFSICDHNTMSAYNNSSLSNNSSVIPAIEFDCWCGHIFMHLLGYGVDFNNEKLQKYYAKTKKGTEADFVRIFTTRTPEKLIKAIHSAGGIAVLAHPACCWALNLERFVKKLQKMGLDGIEVYYPYLRHRGIIKFHKAKSVKKIAKKLGLLATGGTDEHEHLIKDEV